MKDFPTIEKMLILEALECWEEVIRGCWIGDKVEEERVEKDYGIKVEVLLYVLRGMIREWGLGLEGRQRNGSGLLKGAIEHLGQSVIESAADALVHMEMAFAERLKLPPAQETTVETVSVRDTFERAVERTVGPVPYSARRGIPGPKPKPHVPMLDDKPPIQIADAEIEDEDDYGPSYRELILEIMRDYVQPMRAGDVLEVLRRKYPKLDPSESTIPVLLSTEARDDRSPIERIDKGLYQFKSAVVTEDEESTPVANETPLTQPIGSRKGQFVECNHCGELMTLGQLADHKRINHADLKEIPQDASRMNGDTLGPAEQPNGSSVHFEYSRVLRCSKCGSNQTRYRRTKNSSVWVCMAEGCEVKIAHVSVSVDRNFQPSGVEA